MARETITMKLKHIQEELLLDGVEKIDPDTMESLEEVIEEVESRGDCE